MRTALRFLFGLLLLTSASARAQVTITNFNGSGVVQTDQISHYDSSGNMLDAHSGNILQVGATFYMYGEDHACGFTWQATTPFCGFNVYSSTDMVNWAPLGHIFDATATAWQSRCSGGAGGCFWPKMVYNAANNNFVLQFNQYLSPSGFTAVDGQFVMTCTLPYSTSLTIATNCTKQTDPSGYGVRVGSLAVFVDPATGTAYAAYSDINTREIYVQQLNAAYTDAVGSATDTGGNGEAPFLFKNLSSGTWYVGWGSLCGYCSGGSTTEYAAASTALGTYGSATQLSADSCHGQVRGVDIITAGGYTTYLFDSDQWSGSYNEGGGNIYFQPLSFTGTAIDPYSCNTTVTIQGLTLNSPVTPSPTPDQTDVSYGVAHDVCQVTSSFYYLQTFVPSQTPLTSVNFNLGQNIVSGGGSPTINGDLTVSLVTISGGVPGSTLASYTITGSSLSWSSLLTSIALSYAVTPSTTYGIKLTGSNTTGCFTVARSDGPPPTAIYPAGLFRYSSDSGATWTTQTNTALLFSTFGPLPPQIGGGRHGLLH